MSTTRVDVFLDGDGGPVPVGSAYIETRRGTTTTVFEYRPDYQARPGSWSVSPDLPLLHGRATTVGLPGALADSAPDRWGRRLIDKLRRARFEAGRVAPTSTEVDYLLGVSDITRQGALRYALPDAGTFLAEGAAVPPLVRLPELLAASRIAEADGDSGEAVKTLLDAGSGSLGGARPKASVSDGTNLLIAKFPHRHDDWSVMAWEKTALDLAELAGLRVPARRLVRLGGDAVLLVERFDRRGARRVPYVSAMTLVGSTDGTDADYLEVAEALADQGSRVTADLRELWRRIAFSVAINNTDDHLRNHGFLRAGSGWTLAPVFDLNPDPDPHAQRVTGIAGVTAPGAVLDALMDAAALFRLDAAAATATWAEVADAVDRWAHVAARNGIADAERRRFEAVLSRR